MDEHSADPRRHDVRGGRPEVYVQHDDGDAYAEKSTAGHAVIIDATRFRARRLPERVEYHREQHELAQERDDQRRGRNDLGQQQEEHGQREED